MKGELVIPIRVGTARGGFAATTELAGTPICSYGTSAEDAARKAKGTALRLLGNLLERPDVVIDAIRFKTTEV